jgi:hypothetical protein
MGRLALRISRWTTNSLLTVMLLVIALGFGRELLHWWHDEGMSRQSAARDSSARSNGASDAQVLAFGDQNWSIRRQEFNGQTGAVPAALVQLCRSAIADAPPRGDAPDVAEHDVLKRLSVEKPVAEEPGKWRLYQWTEGVPIVIGTRIVTPIAARTILAESTYRVVIWGMAVPAERAWTLYVFQAGGAVSGKGDSPIFAETKIGTVPLVPLPPVGRRLVSVGAAEGSITAFTADDGQTDIIRRFYGRWFAERGWVATVPWRYGSTGWQARFESSAGGATIAVDIRIGSDLQGKGTGLIMVSKR